MPYVRWNAIIDIICPNNTVPTQFNTQWKIEFVRLNHYTTHNTFENRCTDENKIKFQIEKITCKLNECMLIGKLGLSVIENNNNLWFFFFLLFVTPVFLIKMRNEFMSVINIATGNQFIHDRIPIWLAVSKIVAYYLRGKPH